MTIILRPGTPADAAACGPICYEAFKAVAEVDGRIVGSNFLDERAPVVGLGPITVDPRVQNKGVGARLMQDAIDRTARQKAAGLRLLQSAFHNRSLCLYTRLGFHTREPVSVLQGPALGRTFPGYAVRRATPADVAACNRLCHQVHGFARDGEVRDAIGQKSATVVEHLERIVGYSTGIAFFAHSVAETNQGLMALIAAAPAFGGPGFLLPTRNHEVFAWCLEAGLRLVFQMTLMTTGLYNEPKGAWLPSVLY